MAAKTRNRKAGKRLALASATEESEPWMIPTRYLKFVAGLFLLPLAVVLTITFLTAFRPQSVGHNFWLSEDAEVFWYFGLGAALWVLWFFGSIWALGEPRPLRLYVFGHELTHAIWVWVCQGRVSEFRWSREGGYIITDTHNFWIALAPYFYPVYSFAVIVVYAAASIFYDVAHATDTFLFVTPLEWLFLLLGVTWAFHLSFTIWMIPKGQTDLQHHGNFFSLVVIYLMNIALLALLLIVGAPEVTFVSFGKEFADHAIEFLDLAERAMRALMLAWR